MVGICIARLIGIACNTLEVAILFSRFLVFLLTTNIYQVQPIDKYDKYNRYPDIISF